MRKRTVTAAMLVVLALTPAAANEPAEETSEAHGAHERNEIGVFIGITAGGKDDGHGEESATGTIGIDYRRNLSDLIGLGFLFEYSGGVRREHVSLIPVTFFLSPHAQLIAGAGWERPRETGLTSDDFEFLARIGFGYSIELVPGNSIRPEINVDFVDGEELVVIGASIGWGF